MANPVWVLSVDLQTKTATFQSGMADAARSARKAFQDIGLGAKGMGEDVGHATLDVRHSLGLVDNVIRGAHAQAMADVIRLFQRSALVMTALPFAAVVAGFALVAGIVYEVTQKVAEYKAEQEKLGNDMTRLDTVSRNVFNGLSEKILEAEKRADDLRNDSIGSLAKELQLINMQSFGELAKSFQEIAKTADTVFDDIKTHWYQFDIGAAGAKHALTEFQVQYESLLSKGDSKGASDLLAGTRQTAELVLKSMKATKGDWSGSSDNEIKAQEAILQALNGQVHAQEQINQLKKDEQDNAKKATSNSQSALASSGARAAVESQLRMGQLAIEADKETANAQLTVKRASVEARLQSDLDFTARERDVQLAANAAEMAALDKSAKDYTNQLKALKEKQLEIVQQYATSSAAASAKATIEASARDLAATEESIRQSIEATRRGSQERLAAIEAGMKQEEALGLQDTDNYRSLQTQRTEVMRQAAEETRSLAAEAAKEEADNTEKLGMIALNADKESMNLRNSAQRVSWQTRLQQDITFANQEYAIQMTALSQQIAGLDKENKDYENKLVAIQNRQLQLWKTHEAQVTQIRSQAEIERNQRILSAENQFDDAIASGLTSVLMGHKTFAQMIGQLGEQVVSGMLQNALKMILTNKMTQLSDAEASAAHVYAQVSAWPVVGPFVAPVLAAGAFAGVMAFEGGGIVPGVGRGDVVPAMLTPGEGIVPGGVMAGLSEMARAGKMTGGNTHNMHYAPVYHVNTIDGSGVRQMLRQHNQEFTEHYHREVRKMNK